MTCASGWPPWRPRPSHLRPPPRSITAVDRRGPGYGPRMPENSVDLTRTLAPDAPAAPHSASGEAVTTHDLSAVAPAPRPARRWMPKRVVATPAAYDHAHGRRIMALVEEQGLEVERLPGNRLTGLRGETDRETYA